MIDEFFCEANFYNGAFYVIKSETNYECLYFVRCLTKCVNSRDLIKESVFHDVALVQTFIHPFFLSNLKI